MYKTFRLLAVACIAVNAATTLAQNVRQAKDLRSIDPRLLSAGVTPGINPQAIPHTMAAPSERSRGDVEPRQQRKRSSLFGMLSAWTRGSDEKPADPPPAPSGVAAANKKLRPGSRSASRSTAKPGGAPGFATRWSKPAGGASMPAPRTRVGAGVVHAGGAGFPMPIAPASAALSLSETPSATPLRIPPRVPADPAIVALANAPDPQAIALYPSTPAADEAAGMEAARMEGVVFVTDLATEKAGSEAESLPAVVTVAASSETSLDHDPLLPVSPAIALEPPPVFEEPAAVEPLADALPLAVVVSPSTEPNEADTMAVTESASQLPGVVEPLVASVEEPASLEPSPSLSQPRLSPTVFATDEAYPSTQETPDSKPLVQVRQQPRLGLPPRRPAPHQEPSDRAKMLLNEAHLLAQEAHSAEHYTGIVQRCRYVLAFDKSPQAVAYAHELGAWSLNCRGEVLMEQGRVVEAEADFLDALATDAECWRAEHNLGVVEMRRGNTEQSREHFDRTLELNPEFSKAYSNRAALAVQAGDFDSAMTDYERAVEADPDLAVAHTGRGRLCHMLGHVQQALRHLDAAALLSPHDAAIAIARGDLLVDLGRYGPARSAYERAIKLKPESPIAYRNLAWLQATCPVEAFRDGAAALRNAERASDLSEEEDDIALDTYAAALAAAGRFEEAAEVQQRAAEIAPETDAEAYLNRLALYQNGEAFTSRPINGVMQASYTK